MIRVRPARSLPAVLAAVLGLSVVAAPAQAQDATAAPFDSYVALGDSYTSGPLIPVQTGQPPGCLRSNRNFPSLVAESAGIPAFSDASCSGATTEELSAAQRTSLGTNPPQLDALDTETALVTLGIGGNDIGFSSIITECATQSPREPFGAACRDFYTAGGTDALAERIEQTRPLIAASLAAVAERSPRARTLLVGYPSILPDQGPGCFPVVPFSPGDVEYLRDTTQRLNAMLADEAAAAGVDYVDTYTPTIGHDICQLPGTKWIEGLVPTSPAAPVHPNALGMQAIAEAVGSVLVTSVVADEVFLAPGG